jgi:hypothetical protein
VPARKQLGDAFFGNEAALAIKMAKLSNAAANDLGLADPSNLYRRFVHWIFTDPSPCGRCGKSSHRALPGLPPRLFPCDPKDPRQREDIERLP